VKRRLEVGVKWLTAWEAVKTEPERVELKDLHCLEAIAGERLMKTQQAGKKLSGCCGDL
jgi:hypothetical protein